MLSAGLGIILRTAFRLRQTAFREHNDPLSLIPSSTLRLKWWQQPPLFCPYFVYIDARFHRSLDRLECNPLSGEYAFSIVTTTIWQIEVSRQHAWLNFRAAGLAELSGSRAWLKHNSRVWELTNWPPTGEPKRALLAAQASLRLVTARLRLGSGYPQVCSPTAQVEAATAQVQRRKWKLLMSRFRC